MPPMALEYLINKYFEVGSFFKLTKNDKQTRNHVSVICPETDRSASLKTGSQWMVFLQESYRKIPVLPRTRRESPIMLQTLSDVRRTLYFGHKLVNWCIRIMDPTPSVSAIKSYVVLIIFVRVAYKFPDFEQSTDKTRDIEVNFWRIRSS